MQLQTQTSKHHQMKLNFATLSAVCLIATSVGCTSTPTPEGEPLLTKAVVLSAQGNVVGVDYRDRIIKLETPDAPREWLEVAVSDDVQNLAQVRTGDRLRVEYIEAITISLFRPGDVEPGIDVNVARERAAPGERPASAAGVETSVTAVVEDVDRINELVAVRIPDGVYKVFKVSNPAVLDRLSVGDKVRATVTRAWAVGITPGPFG